MRASCRTRRGARPITAIVDPALTEPLAALLPRLRSSVRGSVADDVGTRALYASDASNYRVLPAAVVAPRDADDLAAVVALAAEAGVPAHDARRGHEHRRATRSGPGSWW